MKSLVRAGVVAAFFGISLDVQANSKTFNDLAQADLYQAVSTYPTTQPGAGSAELRSSQGPSGSSGSGATWSSTGDVPEAEGEGTSAGAAPMPESQTHALMLAGIGVIVMMAMRRRRAD